MCVDGSLKRSIHHQWPENPSPNLFIQQLSTGIRFCWILPNNMTNLVNVFDSFFISINVSGSGIISIVPPLFYQCRVFPISSWQQYLQHSGMCRSQPLISSFLLDTNITQKMSRRFAVPWRKRANKAEANNTQQK